MATTMNSSTTKVSATNCFAHLNDSERVDYFLHRQRDLNEVFRRYFGWLPLPFAILGFLLTILFIVTIVKAIRRRRLSRKCYVLLLNRAFGDVFACTVCIVTVGYVLLAHPVNTELTMVLETLFIGSFWTAMVTYVSLSLLKLYAVARPFHFRKSVTMRRCIHIVVLRALTIYSITMLYLLSWVMFTLLVFVTLSVTALVKIEPLRVWSGCRVETCARIMYRARNDFILVCYFSTLISFAVTVLYIRRAQAFVDSFSRKTPTDPSEPGLRFPLWKLALNVATFAGLYLFYVIWGIYLQTRDSCFFQQHYVPMMRFLGMIRVTLLLRIIIDPLISFITDYQIRRGFIEWTGLAQKFGKGSRIAGLFHKHSSDSHASRSNSRKTQTSIVEPVEHGEEPNNIVMRF